MKVVSMRLIRPLTGEVLFERGLTLPDEFADLVQDWLTKALPELLDKAIALHHLVAVKTRELGTEE